MIRLEAVSKHYDDKVAVDDVTLVVPSGSLLGLIGPNGAGKTTTLKMLATLIKPDRGSLSIDGLDVVEDARRVRRIIGYMPDAFGAFRGLSCEEYLVFFGRAYGLWGDGLRRRLEAVLELTELQALRDELAQSLSTGMKQRLSLAKTLLHDPEVLLLDEPASGLDPRARIEIRSLLRELARMGKTVLISSHILADLEEICSDVAIIEQGKVVWSGEVRSVLASKVDGVLRAHIEVSPEDVERALRLLRELPFVSTAGRDGDQRVVAETAHGESNRLLGAFVDARIEVLAFSRDRRSLESIFLERTRGVVS